MGWFGGNGCGGCDNAGTPCFCTGSFTDFQVTFSGVAYNSWTFGGSSTLCAPIGGPNHINGTTVVTYTTNSGFYCFGTETLDGGSGDATKPVQRYIVTRTTPPWFPFPSATTTDCDCYTPKLEPCDDTPAGYTCIGGTRTQNDTSVTCSIGPEGAGLRLRVLLEWNEFYRLRQEYYKSDAWWSCRAHALWQKDIATVACTTISETLVLQEYRQRICGSNYPEQAAPLCNTLSGDGTYDFSSATCSLALV